MKRLFRWKILPRLVLQSVFSGMLFRHRTRRFLFHCAIGFLKGEFHLPDFSHAYPATLHINIDRDFRAKGLGRRLIEHYLGHLKESGIAGVHFGTMSEDAKRFFERLGFRVLHGTSMSYLESYFGKRSPYYVLGMVLESGAITS
jgi:ribosomal protein S18 acetylase RimI-like enzyme